MTLTAHQAYLLGFTPQVLGVFFDGLAVLEAVKPSEVDAWVHARGSDVIAGVRLVETLLRQADREPGDPPASPRGYHHWVGDVRDKAYHAAREAFEAEEEIAAKTARFRVRLAHDLGEQLGEIVHLYVIASLVRGLLEEDPGAARLASHASALGAAQDAAAARLERVGGYAGAEEDIRAEAARVVAALRDGPRLDASSATEISAMLPALELARIEDLFRSPPS
jgi:hypothetical protein